MREKYYLSILRNCQIKLASNFNCEVIELIEDIVKNTMKNIDIQEGESYQLWKKQLEADLVEFALPIYQKEKRNFS